MLKQAIVLRNDLKMGKGKIAAQASHASVMAYASSNRDVASEWFEEGQKKIVLKADGEKALLELHRLAKRIGLHAVLVHDAGHTQIPAGTLTAIAIGPDDERKIDSVTGKLKLL
ncbi:MAG: peptidyl-tRNA hydrolase Pth2 [Candidatus Micrarchaeota archaeon]